MNKTEFLAALEKTLQGLAPEDIQNSLAYYAEWIDDCTEDGQTEEQAVAALGTPEAIREQIIQDASLTHLVKSRVKPRRALRLWEVLLLIVGSPLWLSLLITAGAVLLTVYVVLWVLVIVLFACSIGLACGGLGGIIIAGYYLTLGRPGAGLFLLGCALVCLGLAFPAFMGGVWSAKLVARLGKATVLGIKHSLVSKEETR